MVVAPLQKLELFLHYTRQADSLVHRHSSINLLCIKCLCLQIHVRNELKHFSGTINSVFSTIHSLSRSTGAELGVRVVWETRSVPVSVKNYFK